MKVLQLFTIICALLVSKHSYAVATVKISASGAKIKWYKPIITTCITNEAKYLPDIKNTLNKSMGAWNKIHIPPNLIYTENNCDITLYYEMVTDWTKPYPLAVTTIKHNRVSGEAYTSKIVINMYYNNALGNAEFDKSKFDLQSIITHEIGHALGLNEDDEDTNSAMSLYTMQGECSKRNLTSSDVKSIKQLY